MRAFYYIFLTIFMVTLSFSQEKLDIFDAARRGTVAQITELVKANPKLVNELNKDGYSPLILATYRGNNEVAKYLITHGSDINGSSKMGTPLMAAVVKGNNEIAKALIDNKANVDLTDENGTTALMYATQFKNYEIVSLLVKANANPELKDNRKYSAVDYAILANDDKLIELLKNKNKKS